MEPIETGTVVKSAITQNVEPLHIAIKIQEEKRAEFLRQQETETKKGIENRVSKSQAAGKGSGCPAVEPHEFFRKISPKFVESFFFENFSKRANFKISSKTKTQGISAKGILTVTNGEGYCVFLALLYRHEEPEEIVHHLEQLKPIYDHIGRSPKLIYVDNCCSSGLKGPLEQLFPGVKVKLDAFHW